MTHPDSDIHSAQPSGLLAAQPPTRVSLFASGLLLAFLSVIAFAHPGGVDANGCHKDSSTAKRHCHPERAKDAIRGPIYEAANLPTAGDEGVFFGPFVSIVDGDTFKARVQGVVMDFRLEGVDAPERNQPYGAQSTAELRKLIQGKALVMVPSDTDRYGRTIVRVWVGSLDVSREMAKRGAAHFDSQYSKDDLLYHEEIEARDARRGLWVLPVAQRVAPWDWRKEKR